MRALIQRVSSAKVEVSGSTVGACGHGLLIFVCAMPADTEETADALARKISKLRIFKDTEGRMNRSIDDISGSALVVSQFTLSADTSRGNRPGFSNAAAPEMAQELYSRFARSLNELGVPVETGEFGADMAVTLTNDGPVTIWIDTEAPT